MTNTPNTYTPSHSRGDKISKKFGEIFNKRLDEHKPLIGIVYDPRGNPLVSRYGEHVFDVVRKLGYNVVPIDYNEIFDRAELRTDEYFKQAKAVANSIPGANVSKSRDEVFKTKLQKESYASVKGKHIDGIIFPGDFYNYDTPPFHPEPQKRPKVCAALFDLIFDKSIKYNLELPVFGICGGLQSYVNHVAGPEGLGRVADLTKRKGRVSINHGLSEPDPDIPASELGVALGYSGHAIIPVEGGSIHQVVEEVQGKLPPGTSRRIMVPAAHGGACRNDDDTLKKLANVNAYPVAYCEDGIVEAIEVLDGSDNIAGFFIQGHPESAIFDKDGNLNHDETGRFSKRLMDLTFFDKAKEHFEARVSAAGQSI